MRAMRLRATGLAILLALALPDAAPAQKTARPKGEKYALLVGVRQYETPDLRTVKYAERDVEELARVLIQSGYRRVALVVPDQ